MTEPPAQRCLSSFEATVILEAGSAPITGAQARSLLRALARRLHIPHRSVALLLGDDERLRAFNRDFRGKDRVTDVLSFPGGEGDHLGDIAISGQRVKVQAGRGRRSPLQEARILIIHGFLHLLGYDHETDDGEMEAMEKTLRLEFCSTTGGTR